MIDKIISALESMQEDMEEHGELQKARGVSSAIWLIEIMRGWADRKTESNSEKPNNCEICKHWEYDAKYKWWHCPLQDNGIYECHYEPRKLTAVKTEPTISKMEQVEDEPQSGYCNECKWYGDKQVCGRCRSRDLYTPKDEPQTPMCETCRYDKPNNPKCDECIVGEDKPSNYEPQTDCPWK